MKKFRFIIRTENPVIEEAENIEEAREKMKLRIADIKLKVSKEEKIYINEGMELSKWKEKHKKK